jgi:hypothetical protein
VQSNWIRDKGFGMGRYAPRIVSPVTGEQEAAPATGVTFRPTDENMRRWRDWWKVANKEQFIAFFLIGTLTIVVFSMVAYSTVFGQDIGEDLDFIQGEGNALKESVGSWFGTLFWGIGALSLFAASIGIADYVSRLVADVLKVGYLRESKRWSESRIYSCVVWTIAPFGIAILLAGLDQPLLLTVLAASLSGGRDVHLQRPADRAQPPLPAAADQGPRHQARSAGVVLRLLRRLLDHLRRGAVQAALLRWSALPPASSLP